MLFAGERDGIKNAADELFAGGMVLRYSASVFWWRFVAAPAPMRSLLRRQFFVLTNSWAPHWL